MVGKKTGISFLILIAAVVYNVFYTKPELGPIIKTRNGEVSGIISKSRNGRNYYSYLRIPYAQPPVNQLRFEPPVPVKDWVGILDGTSMGPKCLQFDLLKRSVGGDEDCLIVNVHTPTTSSNANLPVMVFFHGGIFMSGEGSTYNPKYFMDNDIIVVTVNYRLGALGFLNTQDGKVKGNMGLKDQTLALRWVQANIHSFGGNKDSVTIFGESAGASSVHYHFLSLLSKGLFHRAISQSGTAIAHWASYHKPREQALRFAGQLKCPTDNSEQMVKCLKQVPPTHVAAVHTEILKPLREWITMYAPTIETVQDKDTFLAANKSPIDILKSGNINKVPWINGVNSQEGLLVSAALFRNDSMLEFIESNFPYVISKLLNIEDQPSNSNTINSIEEYYVGNNRIMPDPMEKFENYTNLFSDRMFFVPAHDSAQAQSKHSDVYLYYYSHRRDHSLANFLLAMKGRYPITLEIIYSVISRWIKQNILRMTLPNYGVCHADDLVMFFPMLWDSEIKPGHTDYDMSQELVRLWTSFANNEKNIGFNNTAWIANAPGSKSLKYLDINRSPSLIDAPFSGRVELWNSLFP